MHNKDERAHPDKECRMVHFPGVTAQMLERKYERADQKQYGFCKAPVSLP